MNRLIVGFGLLFFLFSGMAVADSYLSKGRDKSNLCDSFKSDLSVSALNEIGETNLLDNGLLSLTVFKYSIFAIGKPESDLQMELSPGDSLQLKHLTKSGGLKLTYIYCGKSDPGAKVIQVMDKLDGQGSVIETEKSSVHLLL